jgi:Rieske Fe-S protein
MTTSDLTRRSVVQGAAAVGLGAVAVGTLAACGSSTPAPAAASGTTVAKADVPVGGGRVVDQVVVTQPTAGDFKAFTAVCTHNQCLVSKIEGGNIVCTCHGSTFDAATGAVKGGLATAPLAAKTVTVSGDNLVVS